MSKVQLTYDDWQALESVLMNHRIGYSVIFDDHNGTAEMIIDIQQIGVYRWGNEKEEASI